MNLAVYAAVRFLLFQPVEKLVGSNNGVLTFQLEVIGKEAFTLALRAARSADEHLPHSELASHLH